MSDDEMLDEKPAEIADEPAAEDPREEPTAPPDEIADPGLEEVDVATAMAEEELPPADDDSEVEQPGVDYTPREGLCEVIEALTFVSHEPMTVAKVREMYRLEGIEVPAPEVKRAFEQLMERWNDPARSPGGGLTLVQSGGGLRFRTDAKTGHVVRRMFAERPQRLSRAALETLAIIAYRQPLTRPQVDEIRGVDSSGALKALMDRRLVRVLGKADDVGRPLLYGTTKTFLEFFGLTSLRDLPTLKQIQELDDSSIGPLLQNEARAAVVMDLFDPQRDRLVSEETDQESRDALAALEAALGQAVEIAKKAGPDAKPSDDDEPRPPRSSVVDDDEDADDDKAVASAEPEAEEEPESASEAEPDADDDPELQALEAELDEAASKLEEEDEEDAEPTPEGEDTDI